MNRVLRITTIAIALIALGTVCAQSATDSATVQGTGTKVGGKRLCLELSGPELYRARHDGVHRALLPVTRMTGAASQTQMVLTGPMGGAVAPSDLDFKVYFIDSGQKLVEPPKGTVPPPPPPTEGDARLVASSLTDDGPKSIAQKLQINENGNYLLQIDVPATVSTGWWYQDKHIVLFGCSANAAVPTVWAETDVMVSPAALPKAAGILFVIALYLFAAIVVYVARRRAAQQSKNVPTIGRNETVERWSLGKCLDPVTLTSDLFDKGSLSNLQILAFTLLVSYGLNYIVLRTGELSSISTTVVGLLGISAIGALGAKVVGTQRNRLSTENWAWLVARKVLPFNDPGKGEPRWSDLIMSDSELDLYKLQALIFSVIVGTGMIAGGFSLATFSVPNELLEVLGLSQLVFVGGRLAKPAAMSDLDDLLTELRKREAELQRAANTGVDVDKDGKPLADATGKPVVSATAPPYTTMADAAQPKAVPTAVQRYREIETQVKSLLEALARRSVESRQLENPPLQP